MADFLGLSPISVYTGAAGTGCLFAKRIHQGRNVRWLRSRVEAHRAACDEIGECNGECQDITNREDVA